MTALGVEIHKVYPELAPSLGWGIPATHLWRPPGDLRNTPPGGSFAAEGPQAERICQPQPLSPPHGPDSPVGREHRLGGQVLLLGVTHSTKTMLHLDEAIARVTYAVSNQLVVEAVDIPRHYLMPVTTID